MVLRGHFDRRPSPRRARSRRVGGRLRPDGLGGPRHPRSRRTAPTTRCSPGSSTCSSPTARPGGLRLRQRHRIARPAGGDQQADGNRPHLGRAGDGAPDVPVEISHVDRRHQWVIDVGMAAPRAPPARIPRPALSAGAVPASRLVLVARPVGSSVHPGNPHLSREASRQKCRSPGPGEPAGVNRAPTSSSLARAGPRPGCDRGRGRCPCRRERRRRRGDAGRRRVLHHAPRRTRVCSSTTAVRTSAPRSTTTSSKSTQSSTRAPPRPHPGAQDAVDDLAGETHPGEIRLPVMRHRGPWRLVGPASAR